jgi:hypothetical protein
MKKKKVESENKLPKIMFLSSLHGIHKSCEKVGGSQPQRAFGDESCVKV